jgi:hypothetical protein
MSELLVPFTTRLGPVQENLSPGKCDLVGLWIIQIKVVFMHSS